MLHKDFKPVTWRGTTNTDGSVIGVSFQDGDGAIYRYSLDLANAKNLSESIGCYLAERTDCQSDSSGGIPSGSVSPQEGMKV